MSSQPPTSPQFVLKTEDLVLYFRTTKGVVQAVDHVDFELVTGRAVVVIGESGCGKTSFARAVLRLLPRNVHTYTGRVYLDGEDVMALDDEQFRVNIRWAKMSLVPQAAMNALNPVLRVSDQVAEALMLHEKGVTRENAIERARQMFQYVGVPDSFLHRYPFELSGGMRQRVAIAMALITQPHLIILDEPTSALDVLTQANIMNVLKKIKWETHTSYMLITHDVATSSELADDVAVMYAGQMVEMADAVSFFGEPLHPYAAKLMAAVPRLREEEDVDFIMGQPPSLLPPPSTCRFAERCPFRFEKCDEDPPMFIIDNRKVRCWLFEKEAQGIYTSRQEAAIA